MHLGMAGSDHESSFFRSVERTGPLKKPNFELNPLVGRRLCFNTSSVDDHLCKDGWLSRRV